MPRFRLSDLSGVSDLSDLSDLDDLDIDLAAPRRRDRSTPSAPRLVAEGRSGRADIDTDAADRALEAEADDPIPDVGPAYSSYDVAAHGPHPGARPGWSPRCPRWTPPSAR